MNFCFPFDRPILPDQIDLTPLFDRLNRRLEIGKIAERHAHSLERQARRNGKRGISAAKDCYLFVGHDESSTKREPNPRWVSRTPHMRSAIHVVAMLLVTTGLPVCRSSCSTISRLRTLAQLNSIPSQSCHLRRLAILKLSSGDCAPRS